MPKLTDTQLIILSHASQRDDHAVATIDKKKATQEAIEGLISQKLLKAGPRQPQQAIWTRNEDGEPLGLTLTHKGLKALGVSDGASTGPAETTAPSGDLAPIAAAPRAGSKLAAIIALMRREGGASIAEMMTATGWQAHSVRGALAGACKTKFGLEVTSERVGDARLYKIAA